MECPRETLPMKIGNFFGKEDTFSLGEMVPNYIKCTR